MREIKFRAWDTDKNKMIYSDGLFEFTGVIHGLENVFLPNGTNTSKIGYMCNGILMQYTGLKDKNGKGKEIYEGDIIYLAGYGNYEVVFPFIDLYEAMAEKDVGEIIGNIYENPKLLEEKK